MFTTCKLLSNTLSSLIHPQYSKQLHELHLIIFKHKNIYKRKELLTDKLKI